MELNKAPSMKVAENSHPHKVTKTKLLKDIAEVRNFEPVAVRTVLPLE